MRASRLQARPQRRLECILSGVPCVWVSSLGDERLGIVSLLPHVPSMGLTYQLEVNGISQIVTYTAEGNKASAHTSDGTKIQAAYSETDRTERSDLTSVGSCRTCQIILPLICCDLEARQC